jgi:phosphopantothenoylcysteine decarboxylase/phosphopantothenate--cysteine ligase
MAEPLEILSAIEARLSRGALAGRRILVTSGPTHEPIDPVRYIANRSSGAQGTAIARALAAQGAEVIFVTGPAEVPPPDGVHVVPVQTAQQMLEAVQASLPVDAGVFAAAVADWRVEGAGDRKLKKSKDGLPSLSFAENPDILKTVCALPQGRPPLVVGFAAETNDVIAHATAKRQRKGCDWILANDVSPGTGIMGGTENAVTLITEAGAEDWPRMGKEAVATRLAERIAAALEEKGG